MPRSSSVLRTAWLLVMCSLEIARSLGNALVAPVIAYVPEGGLSPATGHMRFPGTITVPGETFRKVLEYAAVVEEAARRARKYGGSLGTATQSADDYYGSAQMEAAFNCSDWVFLLRQKPESIEMLDRKGRLSMDEPKKRLLNSLRTEPGVFSELYISSPVGEGVARNILDPATHLLFSNKLEDNAPIDELRAQGLSVDEAITELLRRRGHAV